MIILKNSETNWKYIVILVILAAIVGGMILYYGQKTSELLTTLVFLKPIKPISCDIWYDRIEKKFEDANFCEEDSDCKTVELGSGYIVFGCYKFVNKNTDTEAIYKELGAYYKKCRKSIDDCAPSPKPVCISKKCIFQENN